MVAHGAQPPHHCAKTMATNPAATNTSEQGEQLSTGIMSIMHTTNMECRNTTQLAPVLDNIVGFDRVRVGRALCPHPRRSSSLLASTPPQQLAITAISRPQRPHCLLRSHPSTEGIAARLVSSLAGGLVPPPPSPARTCSSGQAGGAGVGSSMAVCAWLHGRSAWCW